MRGPTPAPCCPKCERIARAHGWTVASGMSVRAFMETHGLTEDDEMLDDDKKGHKVSFGGVIDQTIEIAQAAAVAKGVGDSPQVRAAIVIGACCLAGLFEIARAVRDALPDEGINVRVFKGED